MHYGRDGGGVAAVAGPGLCPAADAAAAEGAPATPEAEALPPGALSVAGVAVAGDQLTAEVGGRRLTASWILHRWVGWRCTRVYLPRLP